VPDDTALTEREAEVVREVLRATVEGPFFPDWEFHALMGLERGEVRAVFAEWPAVVDRAIANVAVNNAFVNLLGYPHGQWRPGRSSATPRPTRSLESLRAGAG
jgi:hypothetical protein